MEQREVLLLQFQGEGHLGKDLRRIIESCPNRDFSLLVHTCHSLDGTDDELSQVVADPKPLVILFALPRNPEVSLDSIFQALGPAALSASLVIAMDAGQEEELADLMRPGVVDFLVAPLRDAEVVVRIRRALNRAAQERKTEQALTGRFGLQQLIGKSPAFLAATGKIPAVAKSDISVLVAGETGTGKEMVGRAIHYLSPRAGKPFVPVNCGAIPVELLENELFGHERGAFTGASGSRSGLIQEAEKGTLFLDEIDCLPLLAQVKLLRFLQDKEYRALGSTKAITGDVRIIAASNANLEDAMAAGTLRRDLYYRLNVVPIVLPPLRERTEDVLLLAHHFLAEYAARLNSYVSEFSHEAQRKLLLYSWPGNVRELQHVVERLVVLCTEKTIQASHLVFPDEDDRLGQMSFQAMKAKVICQFETTYIQNLLTAYHGNISQAAQAAQKERRTFWQLVRKHNIDVRKFRGQSLNSAALNLPR
ncbi:MAG: two-component system, NtrC family, response regulator GlrR [Acidobacteriota bacterium]|jgi:DNA-binding NtrC family response regulator